MSEAGRRGAGVPRELGRVPERHGTAVHGAHEQAELLVGTREYAGPRPEQPVEFVVRLERGDGAQRGARRGQIARPQLERARRVKCLAHGAGCRACGEQARGAAVAPRKHAGAGHVAHLHGAVGHTE